MQVSNFLDRKLTRRFRTFDFDGRIERSDFENSAARLADELATASTLRRDSG
jgi:hypothetical protein